MNKFFVPDNRLKLNDVSSLFCAFELLNLTPVSCVTRRNLNILDENVKMFDISVKYTEENEIIGKVVCSVGLMFQLFLIPN